MTWKGESRRHSLARKGIRTASGQSKLYSVNNSRPITLFHGTNEDHLNKILKDGFLRTPYIATRDEVMEWEEGIILELEIPPSFFENNCRLDRYLLVEHNCLPLPTESWYLDQLDIDDRLQLEDMIKNNGSCDEWWNFYPEDARDYIEEKLKRKDMDLLDWGKENVGAFECEINIPVEFIKQIHKIN